MRLYKVLILINLSFVVGLLAGYVWWAQDVDRLRRELAATQQAKKAQQAAVQQGSARGIVRGVFPERQMLFLTHEDIPGLMPSMTMGFHTDGPNISRGLTQGDQVWFTVRKREKQLVVIALRKEPRP
ncbi:MAG TPA: copper-binding protein [Candidatus Methylomirabilis sp.]|nr:copper-binding protein [Candidatus Methylomirabilis sp.]